ncbi:glycosyltransferase family 2 protein, partial [Candidatus Gottesmanbacteria bacterium]|nr:glycosyltransferase family 2 protein [Candidatus Gottesmanbacteria bacterium]
MLKLSIIIVNYNSAHFLKNCLLSLRHSTLPAKEYEIIIVDNNSKDNSLADAISIKDLKLTIVKNDQNIGFAKANNIAIKRSIGEYVLLLNPDTILEKDTLNIMVQYMEENKKAAVASCKILLPNGDIDDASHRGFPTPWNAFCHFVGFGKIFPQSNFFNGYHLGYEDLDKIHEIDSCVGAFMLIRRHVGEELSWLDEDYFWYGEDLDFCYRVKQKGYKVMYVPLTKIIHYKGISSGIKNHSKELSTADTKTRQLATKARFAVMRTFYKKHYQHKYPSLLTTLVLSGIRLK